jgi:glycosyltransferase involved in cell wall biosynthesis
MLQNENSRQPLFSVIICVYNREKLMRRAIDSLLLQTETDWEAIIADDGSTDHSLDIALSYCSKYPAIRIIHHNHAGHVYTKKAGIFASLGQYITFLDSDDEYEIEHLATRKKYLTENPEVDLLHGGVKIIGDPYVPDKNDVSKLVHLDDCFIGGTFFIKKELINKIGTYSDVNYGDDNDFMKKAIAIGAVIHKIDIKTYIYHRYSEDSICNLKKTTP